MTQPRQKTRPTDPATAPSGEVVHVLIADDHELVRSGFGALLRGEPRISVIGEAADGEEAVAMARRLEPEVVVMDVNMPRLSGIEACREIRASRPATGVLMLTSYADDRAVMTSLMAGASGFVLKDIGREALVEAVLTVGQGGTMLDATAAATVVERLRTSEFVSEEEQAAKALSERQRDVLRLVAEGQTNREIGEQLYLSEKTVKHIVSDILNTLGLTRRAQLAAFETRRQTKMPGER